MLLEWHKPKFIENDNLPFDVDGTTFQSTSGLPQTNIQHRARGGVSTQGDGGRVETAPGKKFYNTTGKKTTDEAGMPNGGHPHGS
jgi:hypothetical protein